MLPDPQWQDTYEREDGQQEIKRSPGFDEKDANTVYRKYNKNGYLISIIYCPFVPEEFN